MIHTSKETDEKIAALARAAKTSVVADSPVECWCLHGAVGSASDWRPLAKNLAARGISTRAVDLWRFLECESVPMESFAQRLNADAGGEIRRAAKRILIGYSMGGRLALHTLLENGHPWDAAVIISAHPGLRDPAEISARRTSDTVLATQALTLPWKEFLAKWNAQPLLAGTIRDEREDGKLIQRRREIARSFVDWSLASQQPLWAKLPQITIPLLWISGENDHKFTAMATEATTLLPNATHAAAPSTGHRVPWENEPWLATTLEAWLQNLAS